MNRLSWFNTEPLTFPCLTLAFFHQAADDMMREAVGPGSLEQWTKWKSISKDQKKRSSVKAELDAILISDVVRITSWFMKFEKSLLSSTRISFSETLCSASRGRNSYCQEEPPKKRAECWRWIHPRHLAHGVPKELPKPKLGAGCWVPERVLPVFPRNGPRCKRKHCLIEGCIFDLLSSTVRRKTQWSLIGTRLLS